MWPGKENSYDWMCLLFVMSLLYGLQFTLPANCNVQCSTWKSCESRIMKVKTRPANARACILLYNCVHCVVWGLFTWLHLNWTGVGDESCLGGSCERQNDWRAVPRRSQWRCVVRRGVAVGLVTSPDIILVCCMFVDWLVCNSFVTVVGDELFWSVQWIKWWPHDGEGEQEVSHCWCGVICGLVQQPDHCRGGGRGVAIYLCCFYRLC